MPFYPSTIYPSSQCPAPHSPGLSPPRVRPPPRTTSLTLRALTRLRHRPPNIKVSPEQDAVIPPVPDIDRSVAAVDAWRKDDAVELWRRKVAQEERRKTLLVMIGNAGDAEEAVDELKRLMDVTILMDDFSLDDLQLPLTTERSGTPSRHLSDAATPTTGAHRFSEIESHPILVPPVLGTSASHADVRARATQSALAAEQRQQALTRRLRLSEQRFDFPPRQVGHSLGPGLAADTGRRKFRLTRLRKVPSDETLEITVESAAKPTRGLTKRTHARAATEQGRPATSASLPLPGRERSATLQVPPAHSPVLTTSALSDTYSLTPIDLHSTPSKAAALLGLFPNSPSVTAARLQQPRPPFARHRVDSNASTASSVVSYWSNCFPSRPSMSSSRTKTSATQAGPPVPTAGHARSDSMQQLFGQCGPAGTGLNSPKPFQGLLPCFRDSVSLPDLQDHQLREILSAPTPPPRPPRHPARASAHSKSSSAAAALAPPPSRLRKPGPSPLSGLARKLSLTRNKRVSTTELKRKQSAKRGLFGMPLRSASQTDLLDVETDAESLVNGGWPAPAAWGVRRDSGFAFPMPPGTGTSLAERRMTRDVWEAESERLRLRLNGVGEP